MTRDDDSTYCAWVTARRADLVRTATLLTAGDSWAAEDLVQTTLTRMYVRWSRVRPETVDAYARRCLLNALLDHRRRSATRLERSTMTVPPTAVDDPEPVDRQSAVMAALARLPPRMRAAIVLRHLLDLSVEATADALGCRPGTVKSQTARGLEQLRSELGARQITLDPDPPPANPVLPPRRGAMSARPAGRQTL